MVCKETGKTALRAAAAVAGMLLLAGGAASCNKDKGEEAQPIEIARLDRAVSSYKELDSAARRHVRDSLNGPLTALMRVLEMDTLNDTTLGIWSTSMPVEIFSPMTDSAFTDLSALESQMGTVLAKLKAEGLELPKYTYAAVAWGRPESVVFADSVAMIALNHYLGVNSPAYEDWPMYRRALKRPDMMAYDLTEALLAINYPYNPGEGNDMVLSRMIYEGVLAEAKMRVVPEARLYKALGFTEPQLKDIEANKSLIWNKLVLEKMLYSKDPELSDRLFSLLPYSTPISPKAPGRTIRYVGYDVVQQYLKHNPKATIAEMLKPEFYTSQQTLQKADYRGEK
ncbi:MAG: hypothetical protein UHP27_09110 [Muribaculaceae bacterium]|nr:hypothetical protein [Muribaculaceae bacterium]